MNVDQFDFELPDRAIALRPARPRDSAKLLHVAPDGALSDHIVRDLASLLSAGDVLVLNDTRVLPAAMTATRPAREHGGGGDVTVGVNLHKCEAPDRWRAFVRPAKRLKNGDIIHFSDRLSATVSDKRDGGDLALSFNASGEALTAQVESLGHPPLPPYIARQRDPDAQDVADYQTVYADETGSVAAPTAGLHFTDALLAQLDAMGLQIERLTLHVGAGTFLPVKSGSTNEHIMHSEWRTISEATAARINAAKDEGRRIIAVGTTALRALESAAQNGRVVAQTGETDIFITPGYDFQIIDGLMTNFHLPRSTLFMLVSAICGTERMQTAYAHALDSGYRFYSYGDSSLLWRAA
ncbi:tRNA preQ1(34) S-adenosylmethionine ribosyltransferase-isomerase QueA [Fretibacter rubidus]|uniref:tRNA preQ1(34) S-adenosylmethionine ribosyltransferase-isomerase QueA n=1 Tax=Fretibacter rubidus TaxID=570162 RepID=UPI00352AA3FA